MSSFMEKLSITGKIMSVGAMGLMLIIASCMISSTVSARQESWETIRRSLVAGWGESQDVLGPVLRVPVVTAEGKATTAWFLPDKLAVDGAFGTELLKHGICKTSVYSTDLKIEGAFPADIAAVLAERGMKPDWAQAFLILGVSDLRGLKSRPVVDWGGEKLELEPASEIGMLEARLSGAPRGGVPFSAKLKLRGSRQAAFFPVGKTTTVVLRSPWATPEFVGPFFPDSKTVDASGFTAAWSVQDVNRSIPQYWFGRARDLKATRFGVEFAVPVDYYRATTRAIQYATMFIFLTLVVFFFVEFFLKQRMHPVQYLLAGSGIVLFYLLLLSLAEHVGFPLAYASAATAIVGVIGTYTHWVFKRRSATVSVSGILSGLYAFFYTLLQMEEYSLLLGSVGMLAALVLIMRLTRDFDWYGLEDAKEA
jgi:inner membrane protein